MRRVLYVFISMIPLLFVSIVKADTNIYYTNEHNVSFTKEQYDFVGELYYDGYQQYMIPEEYNSLIAGDFFSHTIEHNTIQEFQSSNSPKSYYETPMKSLDVSKVCSNYCYITSVLTWKAIPTIKSYDVFGARFITGSLATDSMYTHVMYDGNSFTSTDKDIKSNGFGMSFKLPSSVSSSLVITQSFIATNNATCKVSYQHAKKTSTLAKSKAYTITNAGYGGVFLFTYQSYYDGMQGVTI